MLLGLCCFSTFSILFSCYRFPFFYHWVPLSSLFPWCSPLSGFVELCSIMQIHCCWYFDWHSVHWLIFDIDLHPLLGADEVGGCSGSWSLPYVCCLKVSETCLPLSFQRLLNFVFSFLFPFADMFCDLRSL
jgi:hypothetical protein